MKTYSLPLTLVLAALFSFVLPSLAQQASSPAGVPVSMVVTLETRQGARSAELNAANVSVYQDRAQVPVTQWLPLQGDHAALELFILLEDSPGTSYGTQLDDLRSFILVQPSTTKVGIAYMETGGPKVAQTLTTDHVAAAAALRVSLSRLARPASPYQALGQLIDQWHAGSDRRAILMISNGRDTTFGDESEIAYNSFVESAIGKAQRAGIVLSAIATDRQPIAETDTLAEMNIHSSKIYLSRVTEETGGKLYYYPSAAPPSFAPYLNDSIERLNRQYLVTFLVKPGKHGSLQQVKMKVNVPEAELVSANRVYVPAAQ
jgi:hypothetical protein